MRHEIKLALRRTGAVGHINAMLKILAAAKVGGGAAEEIGKTFDDFDNWQ